MIGSKTTGSGVLAGNEANTVTTGEYLYTVQFDDHPTNILAPWQSIDTAQAEYREQSNTVAMGITQQGHYGRCGDLLNRIVCEARPRGRQTDNWRGREDNHER